MMLVCRDHYGAVVVAGFLTVALWMLFCYRMHYGQFWYNASHLWAVGMLWAFYEEKINAYLRRNYRISALLSVGAFFLFLFAILVALMYFKESVSPSLRLILQMCCALFFTLTILALTMRFTVGNRALRACGTISMETYMIQGLFIILLRGNGLYIENEFLFVAATIATSLVAASVLHPLFSRLPKKR